MAAQTLQKGQRAYRVDTRGLVERGTWGEALRRPRREGHISQKSFDVCVYPGSDRSTGSVCGEGQVNLTVRPYLALSNTQACIATAAADISAKWIELFASLLNVRKYQSVFNSILSIPSPSATLPRSLCPLFSVFFFSAPPAAHRSIDLLYIWYRNDNVTWWAPLSFSFSVWSVQFRPLPPEAHCKKKKKKAPWKAFFLGREEKSPPTTTTPIPPPP